MSKKSVVLNPNIQEIGKSLSYFLVETGKVSHAKTSNKSNDFSWRFCEFIDILESILKARFL